jgi:hypothetical protein
MQASGIPQKLKGLCQKIDVIFYGQYTTKKVLLICALVIFKTILFVSF